MIAEALHGRHGTGGLRALVHDPMPYGLAELLSACLPGRGHLTRVELLRTKFKPGRKLTAYYRLFVGTEVRPIAISWSTEPRPKGTNTVDLSDEAGDRGLLAPFARLTAQTADGRTTLLIAPFDPQLPQLMRLTDPAYLDSMIRGLTGGSPARPPTTTIQPIRYRPGQRHVLQASPASDRDRAATFVKIDRDDCGARAVRFAHAVGPRLAEACSTTRLVSPVGYSVADQAAVWRRVAGRSMAEEVREPARAAPLLTRLGHGVRVLHDLPNPDLDSPDLDRPVTFAGPRPVPHRAEAEVVATVRAGEHLTTLSPELGARYRRVARAVLERLDGLPEEEPRLSHGDLKCDNIVVAGDCSWLLDLDRSGRADPALDVGKLIADLRWWGHHYAVDAAALVRAFLDGYGPGDPARLTRAGLLAVLYQLKLAARRTPVHHLDCEAQVTRQVDAAAASLGLVAE